MKFIQIPHHGSRRNVSPDILDKIIGNELKVSTEPTITAFVSAGENDKNHPKRIVTNAFFRRGCKVIAIRENIVSHRNNMQDRGWSDAKTIKFYDKVESYE